MKLRIGAIAAIILGLAAVVFLHGFVLGAGLLLFGILGLVRSFRPGGYWRKPDAPDGPVGG